MPKYGGGVFDFRKLLEKADNFSIAECFIITLASGEKIYITNNTHALTLKLEFNQESHKYIPTNIKRTSQIVQNINLENNDITFDWYFAADEKVENTIFFQWIDAGKLSGVKMDIYILAYTYEQSYSPYDRPMLIHSGDISVTKLTNTMCQLTVKSLEYKFDTKFPKNVYSIYCPLVFGGESCGKKIYEEKAKINRITGERNILMTSLPYSRTTGVTTVPFMRGYVKFLTGKNKGLIRSIIDYNNPDSKGGQLTLSSAFPFAPAINDEIIVYEGCDKTISDCVGKHSNGDNNRGFRYIPVPEAGLR